MIRTLRANPLVAALGIFIAVIAGLGTVKGFVTDTWPWMIATTSPLVTWLGDWAPTIVAGACAAVAMYAGLQWSRYRDALRRVTRDYYAELSLERHLHDPVAYGHVSAGVGYGEADSAWGDTVYDRYGLPHERAYGGG